MGLFNKAAKDATVVILDVLKRGKTPEQCRCIDYLYSIDEEKVKGCLGKKKKNKKGGCFSKNTDMDMDEYLAHVTSMVNALNLKQRAIEKIGLDESQISEIPPVNFHGFIWRGDGVKVKSELDGDYYRSVSSKYFVTWIFFSATQIYTYR